MHRATAHLSSVRSGRASLAVSGMRAIPVRRNSRIMPKSPPFLRFEAIRRRSHMAPSSVPCAPPPSPQCELWRAVASPV
eukprot:scaffold65057_cov37-Tisochrysis_lutea.AAC.3